MTESEWLASDDPASMLRWVTCDGPSGSGEADLERWRRRPSDRKMRLFACACARAVWPLLADPRSRRAVEVAERYADGGATGEELKAAKHGACAVANSLSGLARGVADEAQQCCSNSAFYAAEYWHRDHVSVPLPAQAALLRDVVGNPWRPASVASLAAVRIADVTLHRGRALAVARRAYDDRDFAALPVLADALEEAGCDDEALLGHLRPRDCPCVRAEAPRPPCGPGCWHFGGASPCRYCGQGPHVRGCWAVDVVLGLS